MGRRYDNVSLLTDYGLVDEFVGVVKAVIRDIAPHAQTIDLTHNIAPFDVRAGSLALARCISYIPSGVIVAVVDPGVGGSRKSIAIEVADGEAVLVGPDNGLLAPAVAMAAGAGRCVVLTNEAYHLQSHGATFAGRDIFAPVAAHLCNGVDLAELGEPIDADALLPGMVPLPREEAGGLVGEVLWVDHFGNCQLNISPTRSPRGVLKCRSASASRNVWQPCSTRSPTSPPARLVLWSTVAACWRWCSISARRQWISVSAPAIRSRSPH